MAKKLGDQYTVGLPNLKVGGPVSPVPTVVAPIGKGPPGKAERVRVVTVVCRIMTKKVITF